MRGKTKKATFNLHIDVLAAIDKAMDQGIAPSKNALVEQALIKELKELRKQARQVQWQEGSRDPLLLKDVGEIEASFLSVDAEVTRRMG